MPINAQNHIHLSSTLGGAPENAPITKWVVTERSWQPRINMEIGDGLTGKLNKYVQHRNGKPLLKKDFRYMVKLSDYGGLTLGERIVLLEEMMGATVYLIDNIHPDDGEDHTLHVRQMFMQPTGSFDKFDQVLSRYYVPIELIDDTI